MSNYLLRTAVIGLMFSTGQLQAALSWSVQAPEGASVKKEKSAAGGHAHGGERAGKPFYLSDSVGAEAEIWLPTLVRRPLSVDLRGVVNVTGTGVLNYHLLYARRKGEGSDEVALRYHYLNGKPIGESPRRLLAYRKAPLDIAPSPLTREHQRYLGSTSAEYVLLFKNKPLVEQALTLTTSNGTSLELKSDAEGRVVVPLPDDFQSVEAGRRANEPAEFVLATHYSDKGVEYHTTLSADYYVNPSHWRSTAGGFLAMLVGFVGGLTVLRRNRNKEQANV
jgi:hypothetical protein